MLTLHKLATRESFEHQPPGAVALLASSTLEPGTSFYMRSFSQVTNQQQQLFQKDISGADRSAWRTDESGRVAGEFKTAAASRLERSFCSCFLMGSLLQPEICAVLKRNSFVRSLRACAAILYLLFLQGEKGFSYFFFSFYFFPVTLSGLRLERMHCPGGNEPFTVLPIHLYPEKSRLVYEWIRSQMMVEMLQEY